MRHYSGIMSVLLTLALPVAGTCAVPNSLEKVSEAAKASDLLKAPEAAPTAGALVPGPGHSVPKAAPSGHQSASSAATDSSPSGKVVETMNSGGYSYAQLEKEGKKTWVAYPTLDTRVGDNLSFNDCVEMSNFQSRSLNRKFETIYFCDSPKVKGKSGIMNGVKSPGSGATAVTPATKISVDKATGANAYTISELYTKADNLDGKQVVVRGQVVKVSSGIMDRNWIHLQDGTGSATTNSNDLVITTDDTPSAGDIVTASGTLVKDKDFGSGYKYNVIIEKATVKK
jgi:hypothetical protein